MSRIGRLPIDIPAGVDVVVDGRDVSVKGPKGRLALTVAQPITVAIEDGRVVVTRPDDERVSRSLHGLTRSLIANNIQGVTQGYSKSLDVVGTGYRVQARGADVEVALRFFPPLGGGAPPGRGRGPPGARACRRGARPRRPRWVPPPRGWGAPPPASLSGSRATTASPCRASTSRPSARRPRTSARSASRSPTRARACAT